MATLTGKKISESYKDLLQVSNSNSGVDATLRDVEDGEGTASILQISSASINIKNDGALQINETAVTSTAAELNILDGVTATTAEINYLDGVTSNIQTQLNAKIEATLTTEQVEDIVGGMLDGTETGISVSYDDTDGNIDFVVATQSDNNFTTTLLNKLNAIEDSATADQTASEIRTLVDSASDSNVFTDADHSKLDGIEASADVTDTANVTSAGALMDSELTSIADVKALDQSVISGASPTFGTANMSDASNKRFMTDAQETKLDSVESNADVTDTANVTSAGALMDSEVDADLKTFSLPANTTISTFGKSIVDDADAAAVRTTIGVDAAGTDNSTNVTLVTSSHDYLSLSGQAITLGTIDIGDDTNLAGGTGIDLTGDTLSIDSTVATLTGSQTLSNKTLASPTFTGDIDFSDANTPKFTVTDTTNTVKTEIRSQDTSGTIGTTTDHNFNIVRNGVGKLVFLDAYTMHNNGGNDLDFRAKDSSGNVVFKVDAGTSETIIGTLSVTGNASVTGDLTVNGTTTTVNQTNLDVSDNIIGLNRGASSNANDSGLIIERGSTGNNAAIIWDESEDKFKVGTTTADASSTGNLTVATGTLIAALEGNASTATTLANSRDISLTGDVTGTTATAFDGSADVSIAVSIANNSVDLTTHTTGNYVATLTAGNLIDLQNNSGEGATPTIDVDLSELSTSTSDGDGDFFAVVDSSNAQKKLTKGNINLSGFNNDSGFTSNAGTVTSVTVTGGDGLTGGGSAITSSGTATLAVGSSSLAVTTNAVDIAASALTAISEVVGADGFIFFDDSNSDAVRLGTVSDLPFTNNAGTITSVTGGTGLTGSGSSGGVTVNVGAGTGISVSSSAVSTNDSEIVHDNLSGFVANEHKDHSSIDIASGAGLTGGGDITATRTLAVGAGTGITVNADDIEVDINGLSLASSLDAANDAIMFHDSGVGLKKILVEDLPFSNNNGDITSVSVTAGTGLSGGGSASSGVFSATLALDFSELTDMTGDISGTTEFILQDGTTESRKAASEIKLSAFNNDSGFTTNTGDITAVTAGTGLDGGGSSGDVTLSVDVSDFMSNGADNRVLTATGADAMNAESTLTWNGSDYLNIQSADGSEGGIRLKKSSQDSTHTTYSISHRDDNQSLIIYSYDGTTFRNWITLDEPNSLLKLGSNSSALSSFNSDGDLDMHGDIEISATNKLYFDGGTHTYIQESSDDILDVFVGGTRLMQFREESVDKVRLPDNIRLGIGNADDLQLYHSGNVNYIRTVTQDQDLHFNVNDGGSTITALQIDASDNGSIKLPNDGQNLYLGAGNDLRILHDGSNNYINSNTSNQDLYIKVNDGGTMKTAIQIDSSDVGAVRLPNDSQKLMIGANDDLRIQHNGSHSFIQQYGTGDLYIDNTIDDKSIIFRTDDGSGGVQTFLKLDGANNMVRVPTDGVKLTLGADSDLQMYHDGTTNYIRANTSDQDLKFLVNDGGSTKTALWIDASAQGDIKIPNDGQYLRMGTGNDIYLGHDGSNTLFGNYTGYIQFRNLAQDQDIFLSVNDGGSHIHALQIDASDAGTALFNHDIKMVDSAQLMLGSDLDLRFQHDNSNAYMQNNTGDIIIKNNADDKDIKFQSDNGSGGVTDYFYLDGSATKTIFAQSTQHADNAKAGFGAASDFTIEHDGSHNYMKLSNGNLYFRDQSDNNIFQIYREGGGIQLSEGDLKIPATSKIYFDGGTHTYIHENTADSVYMVVGGVNTMRFYESSSSGYAYVEDNHYLGAGSSIDFTIRHDGSNTYLRNETGNLFFRNRTNTSTIFDDHNGVEHLKIDLNNSIVINEGSNDIDFRVEGNGDANLLFTDAGNDRIGIGTGSPNAKLDLSAHTSTTSDGDGTATMTLSGQDSILLEGHNGGASGTNYGSICWIGGSRRRAMITSVADGSTDTDYIGLSFYTQGTDGSGDFFESMRIGHDGDVHFDKDVIAFSTTPSDIRLKENFEKIENGLDVVTQLEGHTFNWKKGGERLSAGFKAQEVEKILPHLVDEKRIPLRAEDDKEYKILRYEEMIPYLVEAIKEQQEQINELKEKLNG